MRPGLGVIISIIPTVSARRMSTLPGGHRTRRQQPSSQTHEADLPTKPISPSKNYTLPSGQEPALLQRVATNQDPFTKTKTLSRPAVSRDPFGPESLNPKPMQQRGLLFVPGGLRAVRGWGVGVCGLGLSRLGLVWGLELNPEPYTTPPKSLNPQPLHRKAQPGNSAAFLEIMCTALSVILWSHMSCAPLCKSLNPKNPKP